MRLFIGICLTVAIALALFQTVLLQPLWHDAVFALIDPSSSLAPQRHQLLNHFRYGSSLQGLNFSTPELQHIRDIDGLLHREASVVWVIIATLLLVVIFFTAETRKNPPRLAVFGEAGKLEIKDFQRACVIVIVAIVVLTAIIGLQFEPLFRMAHSLLFTGGNWEFDPSTDLIIQLYPPKFFLYFFVLLLLTLEDALLLIYFLLGLLRSRR